MCHLAHRGQVAHLLSGLSVFFLFIVSLFFNHDFGVIDPPFGARVFVVQMAICGTKIHLASIKKERFMASTDHSVSLALEQT